VQESVVLQTVLLIVCSNPRPKKISDALSIRRIRIDYLVSNAFSPDVEDL
jgi:hypothetical protein